VRIAARSLLILVAFFASSAAWAGALPLSVVSLSSPMRPFTDAAIQAWTARGATCESTVTYQSGPSVAKELVSRRADSRGDIAWRWRVGSNTTSPSRSTRRRSPAELREIAV
jgi:hypothetical protein